MVVEQFHWKNEFTLDLLWVNAGVVQPPAHYQKKREEGQTRKNKRVTGSCVETTTTTTTASFNSCDGERSIVPFGAPQSAAEKGEESCEGRCTANADHSYQYYICSAEDIPTLDHSTIEITWESY